MLCIPGSTFLRIIDLTKTAGYWSLLCMSKKEGYDGYCKTGDGAKGHRCSNAAGAEIALCMVRN